MAFLSRRLSGLAAAAPPRAAAAAAARAAATHRPPERAAAHYQTFSLDSPDFPSLRTRRNAYVDKTGAIADLLASDEGMLNRSRVFFARPRKFGKSLTLSVAGEMLAAGELPSGVKPWPGFRRVDVEACFGGLTVHERLLRRDPSLNGLLERAHFVVKLGLGGAQTGAKLEGAVFDELAMVAGLSFGDALKAEVRLASTPAGALSAIVSAVPRDVPVALLIDEYDAAIIQDVSKGRWAAADAGVEALRSLTMATKSPDVGSRIERCIVTGVARFAHTSLFSGANNFADLSDSPILSRALGFSEAEIRATFPAELGRLAATLGTDVDGAVAELARWYNGYCFDGESSCFSPFPVLTALRAGAISERELEAASGTNWLSLTPGAVVEGLAAELASGEVPGASRVDIADLEAQRVHVVPLLLQTGLLSAVAAGRPALYRPPNEFARRSLQRMVSSALTAMPATLASFAEALRSRNRAAFSAELVLLLERLPRSLFKRDSGGDLGPREAVYHASLFSVLKSVAPQGVDVQIEASSMRGRADIVVKFSGTPRASAWVVEVGLGNDAAAKLPQAQEYAKALSEPDVFCCSVAVAVAVKSGGDDAKPASVSAGGALVAIEWSRREGSGGWVRVE